MTQSLTGKTLNLAPVATANDSLNEYLTGLKSIDSRKVAILNKKISNDLAYRIKFKTCVMEMAELIKAAMATDSSVAPFEAVKNKILGNADGEDENIKTMRLYYVNEKALSAIDKNIKLKKDKQIFTARMGEFQDEYSQLAA